MSVAWLKRSVNIDYKLSTNLLLLAGIIDQPEDSLFAYRDFEGWSTYYRPEFQPQFEVVFNNTELEQNANEVCTGDQFCLFDVSTTSRIEIGLATRDSILRVEEIFELSLEGT